MAAIWKEFPEINRKVAFSYNFDSPHYPVGCHAGSISGVIATFGSHYYAANDGDNLRVLDKTKEKTPLSTMRNEYSKYVPILSEYTKVAEYLRSIKFTLLDLGGEEVYKGIVDKCKNLPLWVMSDAVNYEAPVRNAPIRNSVVYEAIGHTTDFAKYLIDNKIGCVVASPIVQNPNHRKAPTYSLNRGWFWIHPNHLARAIGVTEVYGGDQFPSQKDWIKTIGADLNLDEADVLKSVLNGGVFPEDKRFTRKRDARGRFISNPNVREA